MALFDDLQQVAPALGGEALEPPVVEDQQGDLGEAAHQAVVATTGQRLVRRLWAGRSRPRASTRGHRCYFRRRRRHHGGAGCARRERNVRGEA